MSMNADTLAEVARLADEVAGKARRVRMAQLEQAKAIRQWDEETKRGHVGGFPDVGPSPKETGELRRRSMDLTRALADLRRS